MKRFAKLLICLSWVPLLLFVCLFALELYLSKSVPSQAKNINPNFTSLDLSYRPFIVQHLNPFYLFSFPLEPEQIVSLRNPVCSLSRDGYRGGSPLEKGNRKLAVILGGSAAFGHYATNDGTTISGYLNRIQTTFYFLNCGVPSWNSTQELHRLCDQLIELQPELVIAYDGANDFAVWNDYNKKGLDYPAGTPESFDKLSALVGDIRGNLKQSRSLKGYFLKIFPHAVPFLGNTFMPVQKKSKAKDTDFSQEYMGAAVAKYVFNIQMMSRISDAYNARFIGIFQPLMQLHQNVHNFDSKKYSTRFATRLRLFHRQVLAAMPKDVEYYDFGSIFDKHFKEISVFTEGALPDLGEQIFVDYVHLSDAGNEIISGEVNAVLSSPVKR